MRFFWRVFDPNNFGWVRRQGERAHLEGAVVARLPRFQSQFPMRLAKKLTITARHTCIKNPTVNLDEEASPFIPKIYEAKILRLLR